MEYTPIAKKTFGTDEQYGLTKELHVWGQFNDAKNERIVVYYDIVLLSPTGLISKIVSSGQYTRSGQKFQALRDSQLGQGITALIETDMDMIQSYESIFEDLKQVSP